jgi:[acyl-carrier-protein] S-malonyltransferase
LTLAQAVTLVRFRAQAMQDAVPVGTGAMAAILGMDYQQVIAGCAQAQAAFDAGSGEVVEAVNFNDPGQTVIAGSKAAVEKACEVLKAMGAKRALNLPVSAPFHSSLMKPAAEKLKAAHTAQDIAGIDTAEAELNAAWMAASEEMYKGTQGAPDGAAQGQPAGHEDGGVADAEYEEVK